MYDHFHAKILLPDNKILYIEGGLTYSDNDKIDSFRRMYYKKEISLQAYNEGLESFEKDKIMAWWSDDNPTNDYKILSFQCAG